MNLLDGLSSIFGGFGLNLPETKSENNKKPWYDFSFLEDEEEKSAFETAKKEAKSDTGLQLDDNVSSSYSSPLDTAKIKYGLNQTGYYDGDASTIPNQQMIDGVKKFQKDNNLHIDGMLKPKGETITTMNSKLKGFYATKKYEIGTGKGEKEYIRWQLKQNEKEKETALAPKNQAKPKENNDLFSFTPLKKTEKKEDNWSFEPQKAPAEQFHEEKSLNLPERKQKNISKKEDDYLLFDGKELTWYRNDRPLKSWTAMLGNKKYQDKKYTDVKNLGPLPEGVWNVNQDRYQNYDETQTTITQNVKNYLWRGQWKGGKPAWGNHRVWVEPDKSTDNQGRTDLSIHGGWTFGSAGCIDLADGMDDFADMYRKYGKNMKLKVKYSPNFGK